MAKKIDQNGVLHSVNALVYKKILSDYKVLMFERRGNPWECGFEPIKGSQKLEETPEQAVIREINEESGLEARLAPAPDAEVEILCKLPKLYISTMPYKDGIIEVHADVFVCRYNYGEIRLSEKEHVGYRWMSVSEAEEKNFLKKHGKDNQYIFKDTYQALLTYLGITPTAR